MDKIFSCLVISLTIKASVAAVCTITSEDNCFYTVICDTPARINGTPKCDTTDPYVTLVIKESQVHNATANFYTTDFDAYVRIMTTNGNTWDAVQNDAFSNFKNVLYMDLSDNHIKSIENAFRGLEQLDSLNLSRNYIEEIKPEVFMFSENKNRLFLLDLSYNLLTYLSKDFFVNLYNLQRLYLQGNKLKILGDQTTDLKNLNYLNLCCSNFRTLNITFTALKELDLSFNQFEKFDAFESISTLETINLSHNKFEEVMFHFFRRFYNLKELDLSYNKLKKIFGSNSKDSKRNKLLMKIYLNDNNISHVDKTFFNTFNYIRLLNLSNNNIKEIPNGIFKEAKVLRILSISNNCGLKITNETFLGLHNTISIDISRNNLTSLNATFFSQCKRLRKIVANYNNIGPVDIKLFKELVPSLDRISLIESNESARDEF